MVQTQAQPARGEKRPCQHGRTGRSQGDRRRGVEHDAEQRPETDGRGLLDGSLPHLVRAEDPVRRILPLPEHRASFRRHDRGVMVCHHDEDLWQVEDTVALILCPLALCHFNL